MIHASKSVGMPIWASTAAACIGLMAASAVFAVTPVEATLGASVNAFLSPEMPAETVVTQTAIAAGASALSVSPAVSAGVLGSTLNANLQFNSADSGSLTLHSVTSIASDYSSIYSEGNSASAVPGSLYNAQSVNPSLATFAFVVAGNGAVALNWSIWTTDSRSSELLNNLNYGYLMTRPASLNVYHQDVLVSQVTLDPASLRSTGAADIPFSAVSGDTVVLYLLPKISSSRSGTFAGAGQVIQDVTMSFQVTAVPEPQTPLMMLAGLGVLGIWCRRCRSRRPDAQLP